MQQQRREEAERRLYESRADMWDKEKHLKAAKKAFNEKDSLMSAQGSRQHRRMPDVPVASKDDGYGLGD